MNEDRSLGTANLEVDWHARRVWLGDRELELSRLEYEVLACLAHRAGQVVTYAELWQQAWAESGTCGNAEREAVRSVIKRLRRKLEAEAKQSQYLTTVRGVGVRLRWQESGRQEGHELNPASVPESSHSHTEISRSYTEILMQPLDLWCMIPLLKQEVWHMRRRLFLALGLLATLIILAGTLAFLPLDIWHASIQVRVANPNSASTNISADQPLLGNVPSERYLGRVEVEVWDKDSFVFNTSYPAEPSKTVQLLSKAISALQNPNTPILTDMTLPDQPVGELTGGHFLGHVVVEVWDSQVKVAIKGSGQQSDLAQRAVKRLLDITKYY